MPNLAGSGVVSLGGSLVTGHGQSLSYTRGTDQLCVVGVAPSANVNVASVLSPGSLLFPFSDSGFASLSSASFPSSSLSLSLPSPATSSSWPSSSLSSAPPLSSSYSFLPYFFGASSSVPPRPSSSLFPPPGFPPLVSSSSPAPLSSSSFPLHPPPPSVSFSIPAVSSSSYGVPSSVPPVSSSFSSASSFLDFAAYQPSVLGLSREYQALARWYPGSGGSDFLAYLSAFYPHLSADASHDFSSGSSLFLSALHSLASSLRLPSAHPPPPGFAPPVSSVSSAFPQPQAPPPLPPHIPSTSGLPPHDSSSFYPSSGLGASSGDGFFRSFWVPFCSSPFFSLCVFLFSVYSASGSAFLHFPFLCASLGPLGLRAPAPVAFAASAVPVVAPNLPSPLFCPFAVSEPASVSLASASAPVVSSAPLGFASALGPSSGVPQRFAAPPGASAPPLSAFAFDPGFWDPMAPDPEAPLPQSVPESVRAEVPRMYQYLVDLFSQSAGSLQAPPPPRVLFEEFFFSASAPQQPVYLSWFERVRSALSEANARLASLLASCRPESSLLPLRSHQYAVG